MGNNCICPNARGITTQYFGSCANVHAIPNAWRIVWMVEVSVPCSHALLNNAVVADLSCAMNGDRSPVLRDYSMSQLHQTGPLDTVVVSNMTKHEPMSHAQWGSHQPEPDLVLPAAEAMNRYGPQARSGPATAVGHPVFVEQRSQAE